MMNQDGFNVIKKYYILLFTIIKKIILFFAKG